MPKHTVAKCKLRHPLGRAPFDRDTEDRPTRAAWTANVLEPH